MIYLCIVLFIVVLFLWFYVVKLSKEFNTLVKDNHELIKANEDYFNRPGTGTSKVGKCRACPTYTHLNSEGYCFNCVFKNTNFHSDK